MVSCGRSCLARQFPRATANAIAANQLAAAAGFRRAVSIRDGGYSAADACDAERRAARYRTPSASVCSSCTVPAGTLQESPGP